MSGRILQGTLILTLCLILGVAHLWQEGALGIPGQKPDIHREIQSLVYDYHIQRSADSKWPTPVEKFQSGGKARVDVWPKELHKKFPIPYKDTEATIKLSGEFMINARVYGTDTYHRGLEDLSPLDIAYGFGIALDDQIADQTRVRFGNRVAMPKGLPRKAAPFFSNMHVIPASPDIREAIMNASKDDFFVLRGYVATFYQDGYQPWASDTAYNNNDCEIILVTEILLLDHRGQVKSQSRLADHKPQINGGTS